MADKLYKKLPEVLQTTAVKNFFDSTVEQLFSPANVETINGFIGKQDSDQHNVLGTFIRESTATRHHYSLTPAINTINANTGLSENFIFYDELVDNLKVNGVSTSNHNRLFSTNYSSFLPPIDIDKFINYQEYFWSNNDLRAITVSGSLTSPIDIDTDIIGKKSFVSANNVTLKNGMVINFSGEFVIPSNRSGIDYYVDGVGTSIRLIPRNQNVASGYATAVLTTWDNTIFTELDSNVKHTAGNITSVNIDNPGIGYLEPVISFTGANTTLATATANSNISGSITDVTVTGNGTGYSAPIGITISGTEVFTTLNVANTMVSFYNADKSTKRYSYNKIALDDSSNIFIGQNVLISGTDNTTVESLTNTSIVSIENISNSFDSSRTPGTYTTSGSTSGSGSGQNFRITVFDETEIQNIVNIDDQKPTWSGNATVVTARTNLTKTGLNATGGSGTGATFDVVYDGSQNVTVSINNAGSGYRRADLLTIAGNNIDGVSGPNLTFNVFEIEKPQGIHEVGNITLSNASISDTSFVVDMLDVPTAGNIATSGSGDDAIFNVAISSGSVSVDILDGGIDFSEGDTFTIYGNLFGSANSDTITFTIDNVLEPGDSFIELINGGTGHAVGDTITITDAQLGSGGGSDLTFDIAREGDILTVSEEVLLNQGSNLSLKFNGTGFIATVRTDMYSFTSNASGTFTSGISDMAISGVDPNTGDYYLGGAPDSSTDYGWDLDNDGDGDGDAVWGGRTSQGNPDYNVLKRGSVNRNIWSRVNFWHHKQNYIDAGMDVPSKEYRAKRPIIEFDHDIELYNHGKKFIGEVLVVEPVRQKSDIEGQAVSILIDGSPLPVGGTIIFPNETATISKYIYKVSHSNASISLSRVANLNENPVNAVDGDADFVALEFTEGDVVNIKAGEQNIGSEWYWKDNILQKAQQKLNLHQAPLFNIYNDEGNFLGDTDTYTNTDFVGNKIFNYKIGSGAKDTILNTSLSFKQYYNSSEIQFENFLETENVKYLKDNISTTVPGYYYYKKDKTSPEFHNLWKEGQNKSKQNINTFYYIDRFNLDNKDLNYFIGCEPKVNNNYPSGYEITVKINDKIVSNYAYTQKGLIKFDSFDFKQDDVIEISAYTDNNIISERTISKYELPLSWDHNTQKFDIENISKPEFLEHFSNYVKNTSGLIGESLGSNNFKDLSTNPSDALDIVKTDEDLILGSFLLNDSSYNLQDAINFCHKEYVAYKNRLISEIQKYFNSTDTSDLTNEFILDKVLQNVISFSVGKDVFQRTYTIPFGDNYVTEEKIINTLNDTSFTPTKYIDLSKIENSILVYKVTGTQTDLLEIDKDYTISSTTTSNTFTPTSSLNLQLADRLIFKIYDKERDSAECPATPSVLGLYPLTQPVIETDNSFQTPIEVVIGHDGSKTPTVGNKLDEILLEFETRIYNSAKKEFRDANSLPELNVFSVRAGKFRDTNFTNNEWYDLMRTNFNTWNIKNNTDFVTNEFYDSNNEWTWNYRSASAIPGHWRGWYEYYYDTVRPNTNPWEMLGFTEKPTWWDTQYITTTYTDYSSNNTPMWEDLELGLIRQGPRENLSGNEYKDLENNPCARPGLKDVLPVDSSGNLKSPYDIDSTGATTITKTYNETVSNTSLDYKTTSYLVTDGLSVYFDSSNVYVSSKNISNYSIDKIGTLAGEQPIKSITSAYSIPQVNLNSITLSNTSMQNGATGVLTNGQPIYNPSNATSFEGDGNWTYNAGFLEKQAREEGIIAHTDNNGLVHTHVPTVEMSNTEVWGNSTTHSGIVGWAFDGLPIYGPYGYSSYHANGSVNDNSITNVKSSFELKPGSRSSHPGGTHTGLFLEDYQYSASLASQNGTAGKFNTRYGTTPESPSTPIRFYVTTIDDNGEPMFPYAVGGGTKTDNTYNGEYYATPQDLSNNRKGIAPTPSSVTTAIRSTYTETQTNDGSINEIWRFGDGAPVENAWKYSSSYPFAVVLALFLSKPGKFARAFADPTALINTKLGPKSFRVEKSSRKTWNYKNQDHFKIHGTYDENRNFITNIGYSQFIRSWLKFQNYDVTTNFKDVLTTLNTKISHRMAGFVDGDTATVKTDQFSTTGNASSIIIPVENRQLSIHDSGNKTRNNYTGVIIEKTLNGYKVKGYDPTLLYFNILESDKTQEKQSITRGGKPVSYTNWQSNKYYPLGTIVNYLGAYYKAKINVPENSSFVSSQWDRLPSLPQEGGATGIIYNRSTGIEKRVDYGKEYTSDQDVFDLLVSIGRYQKSIGYDFGDYDESINSVKDWVYAAEQFLFWVTGGWEIGNTLELSPCAGRIIFSKEQEAISEIKRLDRGQFSILDQDSSVIDPKECDIIREGNNFEIRPPVGKQIFSITLFTKQIEHILSIDNISDFNDTYYNDLINQRIRRIKIKGRRTLGWEGRLSSEGFIIDGPELQPNLDNITATMANYHNIGFIPVDKQIYNASRSLIGFSNKKYLTELGIDDDDQVEFYKGMIQSKGTLNSISKILNSNAIVQGNVNIYDEWALKAGSFGDLDNNQSIELKLSKQDIVQDPQLFTLEFPEDITGLVKEIVITERNASYYETPLIELGVPSTSPKKQATAVATLSSDGTINSISITEPGSGYVQENTTLTVLASNLNVTSNTYTFNYVSAVSTGLFPQANTTGIANITIIDHFASNTSAQTIDLSSATEVANVVTAINSQGVTNANIVATSIETYNASSNTSSFVLQITGSDFSLGGSGLANLNLATQRYQPRQRFGFTIANNTTVDNVIVSVDSTVVPRVEGNVTYWEYDAGDRFGTTTSTLTTSGTYDVNIASLTGMINSSSILANENTALVEGIYPYVDVYVNGTKLENTVDQNQYSIPNNTTVRILDVTNLEEGNIAPNSNIYIVEKATIDFTDDYQGDVPASNLSIKVQSNEGFSVQIASKRIYDITPDIKNDEIITIDIDDKHRFLKKPAGIRTNEIWPLVSNVDYTGVKDTDFTKIPNAGYVDRRHVNYQSFGVIDMPALFGPDRVYKPSKNELIHIAKSDNDDWNVYKLREPKDLGVTFVEQDGTPGAYLYTTADLFDYVDSNQLQQTDLSRFLDYTLVLKQARTSEDVVLWTNQEVVDKKSALIRDFGAITMLQANIDTIGVGASSPFYNNFSNISPATRAKIVGDVIQADANGTVTMTANGGSTIQNGDKLLLIDPLHTEVTHSANSLLHSDTANATSGSANAIFDSKITITASDPANVNNIVSNITMIDLSFSGSNVGDFTVDEVTDIRYTASNVDYVAGTFDIQTDDTVFQSYFGNIANTTITGVTNSLTSIEFTVHEHSNVHLQTVTASNVNLNNGTYTFNQSNVTANASNIVGRLLTKCELTVLDHGFYTGEIVKVLSNNIRGYYQVESATQDAFVINAPYHANLDVTGQVLSRGLHIKTSEPHNLPVGYNGKRVMIHQSQNPYYNQTFNVGYVKNDTEIIVEDVFAWNATEDDVSPTFNATVNGAVVDSNSVKLTSPPIEIGRRFIVTGTGITERVRVTDISKMNVTGVIKLDKKVTLDDSTVLSFEKECVLTTLDHDVIKLNNTSFRIDDITTPQGIVESLNNTQAVKAGLVNKKGNTFGLGIPMLKKPYLPDGTPYRAYAGKTPYVRNEEVDANLSAGMDKMGHIKIKNPQNAGYKPFNKGAVTSYIDRGTGFEVDTSQGFGNRSPYDNYVANPQYFGTGGNVVDGPDVNVGQTYSNQGPINNGVIDVPVYTPKINQNIALNDNGPGTPIFTGQALQGAPEKRCGPDACASTNRAGRGIPHSVIKNNGPITWNSQNCGIESTGTISVSGTVTGTGHGKRSWTSGYSGYYGPTGQTGGTALDFRKRAIAGALTWSDNGSTQSFQVPFKVTENGKIYVHGYQSGKGLFGTHGGRDTTFISVSVVSGNATIVGSGTVKCKYMGEGYQPASGVGGVIEVDMLADSEILITGTCKGGSNHWHGCEMHVSGKRDGLNKQSERIVVGENNTSTQTGTQSGNGDYVIFDYTDKMGPNKTEEFLFESPGSGTATILFNNYSGSDGIQVFSGPSKGSENNLVIESTWGNLRRLTDNERQELRNKFVVSSTGASSSNYAKTNYDQYATKQNVKPKSPLTGQKIGVVHAGAMDFDIPAGSDRYIKVVIPKASYVFDHIIKLPNATPPPDDPATDPNPTVPCGQQTSMPTGNNSSSGGSSSTGPGANTSGTGASTSSNNTGTTTSGTNPSGASGGAGGGGGGGGGYQYTKNYGNPIKAAVRAFNSLSNKQKITPKWNYPTIAQTSGFYRSPMAGMSFIPSIYRKTVKMVAGTGYGLPISLTSGRYVNNQVQKISGGFVVPLAQRLTKNIPLKARPLRNLDAAEYPYYNVLDANKSAFEKGGMFYDWNPKKIRGDYKLDDGTFLDITGATLTGADVGLGLGNLLYYSNPYNGTGVGGDTPVDTMPVTPPEELAEGPIELNDDDVIWNPNFQITLQPKINGNVAGPKIIVPLYKPVPGHTIDTSNLSGLNPEDTFSINGRTVGPFKGTSPDAILKAINCVDATGFEATPLSNDLIRISSCSNVPLTIKEGCSGGLYKEVLDFHINRAFVSQEISNTSTVAATTNILDANGSVVDTAVSYAHLDVSGGVVGYSNVSAGQGYVSSSNVVQTGGSGYSVGDRLRVVGGTPIKDPFTGVKEICIKNSGAGYSLPENIIVTIGDGSTPGRNALVKNVVFDKNNGIKKVNLYSGGEEFDVNRPPKVTIIDTGSIPQPQDYANTLQRGDFVKYTEFEISNIDSIGTVASSIPVGNTIITEADSGVTVSANANNIDGVNARLKIIVTQTDAGVKSATVEVKKGGRHWYIGQTFTIRPDVLGGTSSDTPLTFQVGNVNPLLLKYAQLNQDSAGIDTLGDALREGILTFKSGFLQPQQAELEAVLDNKPGGRVPRVAKFEVTSVDYYGTVTSVKILDRGIYKVFPSDLTNGLPLEYDHILLGDEAGFNDDGTEYVGGSGLGQFDPITLDALSSPGGYDPINNLLLGGAGAKIFLTASEIPDCSQPGSAKRALGLPDVIADIDAVADFGSAIQGAIGNAGYGPDDFNIDINPINDLISQIDLSSPIYDGIEIGETTPGVLDSLGLPPGDYNIASLCVHAVVETKLKEENQVVANRLNQLVDDLGLGLDTSGPIDVIKLLCVDTIGSGDDDNGQDGISIFGDGDVEFLRDLFQYELRSLTGDPVRLLSSGVSQEADILYLESQRFSGNAQISSANTNYPEISSNISSYANIWIDNYNDTGKWAYLENSTIISQQEDLTDTRFINKIITYNDESGIKQNDIHLFDPFKGILPGFIENEIHFIGENDPVVYDTARSNFCDDKMIGKVWWDTSTIRYNWYEQGTARDRWQNWGSTFPGSNVSIYEWVKSDLPPASWTLSGTPRSQFITKTEINPSTNKVVTYYYFWVRNYKTLLDFVREEQGRNFTAFDLAKYIADPVGYGLNLISFINDKSFVMSNIAHILDDDNDNLQINFSRNKNPNGKKHDSWLLARQGDNNSKIPEDLSQKLIDSLCGYDAQGQAVPDRNLSNVQKYGSSFRPRQTFFKNVKDARKVALDFINDLFKSLKMNTEYQDWDNDLVSSRNYISVENWYAKKSVDQITNLPEYYDDSYKPVYRVNSVTEFNTLSNIRDGVVVQVKGSDTDRSRLFVYNGNLRTFKLISVENEIIQLKDGIFNDNTNTSLDKELRSVLQTIKDNKFNNASHWNKLFFLMLEYAYGEHSGLDWAFKTSYVFVEKEETDLIKFAGFKPDNFEKVLEYMNEVKPYSSKIREYKDGKNPPLEYIKDQMISDYDKPPYADFAQGTIRILDENVDADYKFMANTADYVKYHSIANKNESPIRQTKTSIVFDRTNWQPTQFQWNPSTESANSSIATNIAWIKSASNSDVSGNSNVRSIDRIIKFDTDVSNKFTNEMEIYLTDQGYVAGSSANTTLISNATILLNAIEAGSLDGTLNSARNKVGGNFIGDILDANVFSKVVDGYDPSTDYQEYFGYDSEAFDTFSNDLSIEVINYSGTFDSSLVNFRRNDQTYEGFDGVTFSRMLYGEDRPEELIQIDPKENVLITVTTSPYANADATGNIVVANAQPITYRIHRAIDGESHFLRVRSSTTLSANLLISDRSISVANASVLPRPTLGVPGVMWIESERITYKERDIISNTISDITRGTKGTSAENWYVTDEAGATITLNVYDGSSNQEFTDLVGTPESNTFFDTGAVSLTDYNSANASSITSIMKFLHDK